MVTPRKIKRNPYPIDFRHPDDFLLVMVMDALQSNYTDKYTIPDICQLTGYSEEDIADALTALVHTHHCYMGEPMVEQEPDGELTTDTRFSL